MDFSAYATPSPQWQAFIASNPSALQDGHGDNSISNAANLRARANETREANNAQLMKTRGLHDRVEITTVPGPSQETGRSIPIRRYAPRDAAAASRARGRVILFFHGGGMLFGSETTDNVLCATMASELQVTVLSVIYRHTPDHQHPAQHDDAWDAFQSIETHPEQFQIDITEAGLVVMGISAGGGLATGVVMRHLQARESQSDSNGQTRIRALILSIPWLIHIDNYPFEKFVAPEKSAHAQNKVVPVIPEARLKLFSDLLAVGDPSEPILNVPIAAEDSLLRSHGAHDGWPNTAILIAGMDPLRDDGLLFARRLESCDVPTNVHVFPGVPHGFQRWPELETTKVYNKHLLQSIEWGFESEGKDGSASATWQEHFDS